MSGRQVAGEPSIELSRYTDVCKILKQLVMENRVKCLFDIKETAPTWW